MAYFIDIGAVIQRLTLEICLFLAALGLRCCGWALSSFNERACPSLWCSGFSLLWLLSWWSTDSRVCGLQWLWLLDSRAQAQELWLMGLVTHSVWNLPRPGLKPMSPVLAGTFFTTEPPEKPPQLNLCYAGPYKKIHQIKTNNLHFFHFSWALNCQVASPRQRDRENAQAKETNWKRQRNNWRGMMKSDS